MDGPTPDPDPEPTPEPDPQPTPGQCIGEIPDNPPEYQGVSDNSWSGYSKGAFIMYNDKIWQVADNTWWADDVPGTSSTWTQCEAHYIGTLNIKVNGQTTGLSDDAMIDVVIGDKLYKVSINGGSIELAQGTYEIQVDDIIDFEDKHIYKAKLSSNIIEVKEKGDYGPGINFTMEDIAMESIDVTVSFPFAKPSKVPSAKITSDNGYSSAITSLHSGKNNIKTPEYGSHTIQADSYQVNDKTYRANAINIIDGKVQGDAVIQYQEQVIKPLMVGYLTSWNKQLKISEAASKGYNTIVLAFAKVEGNTVSMVDPWNTYVFDWENSTASWKKNMKEDIELAKSNGELKHVLLSVG